MSCYRDIRWNVFCQRHHRDADAICYFVSIETGPSLGLHILTSPYLAILVRITSSGNSGGRFAIRTLLVPRPAVSTRTIEISPLVCRYSACPPVKWSTCCSRLLSHCFIYTCLWEPSIYTIKTSLSSNLGCA